MNFRMAKFQHMVLEMQTI
uniref:Uncharacterized protein n=1 Tax=Arundo donax TaxID=35708 RepID=A0A0A8YY44_ARUDO